MDLQTTTHLVVGACSRCASAHRHLGACRFHQRVLRGRRPGYPVMNGWRRRLTGCRRFVHLHGRPDRQHGVTAAVLPDGWTGGYALLAMLLAPYLRKFRQSSTVPQFIGDRFYRSRPRRWRWRWSADGPLTYIIGQMTASASRSRVS